MDHRRFTIKAQLASLKEMLLEGWGNEEVVDGPNYVYYVRLQAAIDDFPRVRAYLANKSEAAERPLAEFERTLK